MWSTGQFLWCKSSRYGQFQATNVKLLNMALGRAAHMTGEGSIM